MSFTRGIALIAAFSLLWGVLAGVNAALLHTVAGTSWGLFSLALAFIVAFFEALALLEFGHRWFLRSRLNASRNRAAADESPGFLSAGQLPSVSERRREDDVKNPE